MALRASAFGGCIRAQVAAELGYVGLAPPPRMQAVFDAGNEAEDKAIERLNVIYHYGVNSQQREVEFIGITGHIDGIIKDPDTSYLVEIKSFSDEQYAKFLVQEWDMGELMERYKWQVSVYMHALPHHELLLVGQNRETEELHILPPRALPFHTAGAIEHRKDEIMRWVDRGELPPCDTISYPCPFVYLHIPDEKDDDPLIEDLGEQYRTILDEETAVQDRKTKVRAKLEEALGARDVVDCEHVKVTRYWQKSPARADVEKLKKDGLWEQYEIPGAPSRRLKVTLRDSS